MPTAWKDKLPGGLADKRRPEDFDPRALRKGQKVESEHTDDPAIALEIAMDHLTEDPAYYDKLAAIEKPVAPLATWAKSRASKRSDR